MDTLATKMALTERLASLEAHLKAESPMLIDAMPSFYKLDKLLRKMGLMETEDSLATRIPWWPLISVLGTFSSGKSTFINDYLGQKLQATGNQAVDDMFTVVCYGPGEQQHVLPGMALDADPRFPFYRMSDEIEEVVAGEGKRIDSYLQLKTSSAEAIKGKIVIDSPGFDADDQRRSTLRITDHIIGLSDLVLVFFDARHPEPGAMQDTLQHLVSDTVHRPDAGKFMYILNQIDVTAREDNPEEVVAAWQRAVSQAGLATGRFFTIYNEEAAMPIEDAALRKRYRSKRDTDVSAIKDRIADVGIERNYRIVGVLQSVVDEVERELAPALEDAIVSWRNRTLIGDGLWLAALVLGLGALISKWEGVTLDSIVQSIKDPVELGVTLVSLGVVFFAVHFWMRSLAARSVAAKLPAETGQVGLNLRSAFLLNTRFYRSIFRSVPAGWGRWARKKFRQIRDASAAQVQRMNDLYADPSGEGSKPAPAVDAKPIPTVETKPAPTIEAKTAAPAAPAAATEKAAPAAPAANKAPAAPSKIPETKPAKSAGGSGKKAAAKKTAPKKTDAASDSDKSGGKAAKKSVAPETAETTANTEGDSAGA